MKSFQGSDFEAAKTRLKYILIFDVAAAVGSVLTPATMAELRGILSVAVLLGFIAAVYTVVKGCRCPYCGKVIFLGVLTVRECPKCRRNLVTGKKMKKSKR